jgi:hypothetical protein
MFIEAANSMGAFGELEGQVSEKRSWKIIDKL